ncbi:MAG: UDP-N-acetylmuramate dehydrogenase [Terriglobia bacterium]
MPSILENEPLKPHTTFKIGGPARYFATVANPHDLRDAAAFASSRRIPLFVLGGGSNLLISDAGLDALVVHPVSRGITVRDRDQRDGSILLRTAAGESWDGVVAHAVGQGWRGVENLSHIPGQAGAALVQNIGAYGQQLSDVLESAEVAALDTGAVRVVEARECGLGYRRSIFNTSDKNQRLILAITLRLAENAPSNLSYPDLRRWFGERGVSEPSIAEVREAIIAIRDRKFPYPREEKGGNAGSFFKNLSLHPGEYESLEPRINHEFGAAARERLREIRARSTGAGSIRIPTAFLIELCGLKGCREGGAEINETQPLVILNQGGATARDVLTLAQRVRRALFARTAMRVEIEPELAGFTPTELSQYLAFD